MVWEYGTGATGEEYAETGVGSESDGEYSSTASDTDSSPDVTVGYTDDDSGGYAGDSTYNGHKRSEYDYTGTETEDFNDWVEGNITTNEFQTITKPGNGTDSLVEPTDSDTSDNGGYSGGMPSDYYGEEYHNQPDDDANNEDGPNRTTDTDTGTDSGQSDSQQVQELRDSLAALREQVSANDQTETDGDPTIAMIGLGAVGIAALAFFGGGGRA